MLQRPGSSWGFGALLKDTSVVVLKEDTPPPTIPAGPEIRTHNLPFTSPTRYPLGPRHASLRHHATQSDVPSRIARINIVCLHYDAIYSFGCFIFTFMNLQVQLIICTCIQTMAVLKLFYLPSNGWSMPWVNPVAKCGEKSYMTVIVWLRCLHVYTALQ